MFASGVASAVAEEPADEDSRRELIYSFGEAAASVGIQKLMWGSDYPRTITAITYRMSYDFLLRTQLLTPEEQAQFLGENARQLYGFKNLPDLPYIKNMSE